MASLHGYNQLYSTIPQHQQEDGYVCVKSDGYTVSNSLIPRTLFQSFIRTGAGLWTATLKGAYPCNAVEFTVVPVLYTSSSPAVLIPVQLGDNVGVKGTVPLQQVFHFGFTNVSGTFVDLPPNAGFRYKVGLQLSTANYIESY